MWTAPLSEKNHENRMLTVCNAVETYDKSVPVADIATGSGLLTSMLRDRGFSRAWGYDITSGRFWPEWEKFLTEKSALEVDYGSYDVVACVGLLYHLDYSSQCTLRDLWSSANVDVIIDTHISSSPDIYIKNSPTEIATGQMRAPTTSTKTPTAFVPTRRSIIELLMGEWSLMSEVQTWTSRYTYHFKRL